MPEHFQMFFTFDKTATSNDGRDTTNTSSTYVMRIPSTLGPTNSKTSFLISTGSFGAKKAVGVNANRGLDQVWADIDAATNM